MLFKFIVGYDLVTKIKKKQEEIVQIPVSG